MPDQVARAEAFKALHVPGRPLVLFNIWDAGSAMAVAASGAKALATGSWSVAAANGFKDGENISFDFCLSNLVRIIAVTDLPVTIDLESGYGTDPKGVGESVTKALKVGAVGCNIEDAFQHDGSLRDIAEQVERLKGARAAAEAMAIPMFLNARTDVFFQKTPDKHDEGMVDEALERGHAYAEAGADGLFVPGLSDPRLISLLTERSPLPVNIMATGVTPPAAKLAELKVARISHGPSPYRLVMKALENAALEALAF